MSSLVEVDSFNAHVIGVGTGRASWALPPLFFAKLDKTITIILFLFFGLVQISDRSSPPHSPISICFRRHCTKHNYTHATCDEYRVLQYLSL